MVLKIRYFRATQAASPNGNFFEGTHVSQKAIHDQALAIINGQGTLGWITPKFVSSTCTLLEILKR